MVQLAKKGYTLFITLYVLMHFVVYFTGGETLSPVLSIFGLTAFLLGYFFLPMKQAAISLLLLVIALIIHLTAGTSLIEATVSGFTVMSGLIALLLIVPTISWVLEEKPYIEAVINFAQNLLNTSRKFYFGMMVITQIISYFLLFGSIPMVYGMIDDFLENQKGEVWENYKGTALLRGFSLTTMWVVSIPSFIFAVQALGASLGLSILQGFVIAFAGTLLSVLFSHFQERHYGVDLTAGIQEELGRIEEEKKEDPNGNRDAARIRSFIRHLIRIDLSTKRRLACGSLTDYPDRYRRLGPSLLYRPPQKQRDCREWKNVCRKKHSQQSPAVFHPTCRRLSH